MEKEELFPSCLLLSADMWLLSTAIYLVTDVEVQAYVSLAKDSEASIQKEIYQMAVGSFKAGKLELQWDEIEGDYWVNPDEFLKWCIEKDISNGSTMIEFYKNTVMQESPYCLAKEIKENPEDFRKFRKIHPATEAKYRTLAMVEYKLSKDPETPLHQLIKDGEVRSIGGCGWYKDTTIRDWIQEAYPQFKRPPGRPPKNQQ